MFGNYCQSFFEVKNKNSQGARKGKGIMTARQTEALASLLFDAGLMLGRVALRELDRRWQQYERDAARREQVQRDYINMHQYDIDIE